MPRTVDPVVTAFGSGDQPEFDLGDGLTLRQFALTDGSVVRAAFTDRVVVRWHHFRVETATDARAWIERTHSMWAAGTKADWLIEEHGLGRVASGCTSMGCAARQRFRTGCCHLDGGEGWRRAALAP